MKDKFKILFIPFLVVNFGLLIGYTLLHWLIFIKLDIINLKEIYTNFGIPAALTGIFTIFVLRPKLKALNLKAKRGDLVDFYSLILWIILSIPLVIAQEYVVSATGILTEVNSINDINESKLSKYYSLNRYYIDKQKVGINTTADVSGKNNESFNMHIYVAMPIFEKPADTIISKPKAWLGVVFQETISNRLDDSEKDKKFRLFAQMSESKFKYLDVTKFIYLDRIGNSDKKDGLVKAIQLNKYYDSNEIVFMSKNEPFEARNGSKLEWLIGATFVGSIIWLIMLLIPSLNTSHLKRIKAGKPDKKAQREREETLKFFLPREGYFVTPILIYVNVFVFIAMVSSGAGFLTFNGEDLFKWGGNFGPSTTDGEWWRLLTNIFLHGGLMHLLLNMYGLLFVGIFLEPMLGKAKYILAYLATGILASTASIMWHEATLSIGASGAIFGLYGIFLALMLTKVYPVHFSKMFMVGTLLYVGINIVLGFTGGIDNAAHIGGLLSGFLIGLILTPILKNQISKIDDSFDNIG
jgi:rhomboid protease GluP